MREFRMNSFFAAVRRALFPIFVPPLLCLSGSSQVLAAETFQWAQFAADGLEARAATSQSVCPEIVIDSTRAAMTVRARPMGAFPVLVCSAKIPRDAKDVSINGRPLAVPPQRIDKIVLIGDTGCRLKAFVLQGCNSMKDWPFRLVADAAAENAPELVLHLGDLIYRERACPATSRSCAGSPFGDNWETWKADFFEPAQALLGASPWLFIRGNHESCGREGVGWSRFLSAWPFDEAVACTTQEQPFFVDIGDVSLAALDVTQAEDRIVDAENVRLFRNQFSSLSGVAKPVWVAMHKPVYGVARIKDGLSEGDTKTLVEAARGATPANVQAIFSGHLHTFQTLSYAQDIPSQIIVGTGGDMLDAMAPRMLDGLSIADVTVSRGSGAPSVFGYSVLERAQDEWLLTQRDRHGAPGLRCHLRGRKIVCD